MVLQKGRELEMVETDPFLPPPEAASAGLQRGFRHPGFVTLASLLVAAAVGAVAWLGHVRGLAQSGAISDGGALGLKSEREGRLGTSLFCFMGILPGSSEEALKFSAKEQNIGVFACDSHRVYRTRKTGYCSYGVEQPEPDFGADNEAVSASTEVGKTATKHRKGGIGGEGINGAVDHTDVKRRLHELLTERFTGKDRDARIAAVQALETIAKTDDSIVIQDMLKLINKKEAQRSKTDLQHNDSEVALMGHIVDKEYDVRIAAVNALENIAIQGAMQAEPEPESEEEESSCFGSGHSGNKFSGHNGNKFSDNSAIFVEIWNKVFEEGLYKEHDWTIKVDADTVWIPHRLVRRLHAVNAGVHDAVYITNFNPSGVGGLPIFGAIEVLSQGAVTQLSQAHCPPLICNNGSLGGEDNWLHRCVTKVGMTAHEDLRVLSTCKPQDVLLEECENDDFVAYHPFKAVDEWKTCASLLENATETGGAD